MHSTEVPPVSRLPLRPQPPLQPLRLMLRQLLMFACSALDHLVQTPTCCLFDVNEDSKPL